jgi:predicted AlkP superfamily phosphohydrolase/phosphomutase
MNNESGNILTYSEQLLQQLEDKDIKEWFDKVIMADEYYDLDKDNTKRSA